MIKFYFSFLNNILPSVNFGHSLSNTTVCFEGDHANILLELGSIVRITTDPRYEMRQCKDILFIDYEDLINSVSEGDIIYLDKGRIMLRVQSLGLIY